MKRNIFLLLTVFTILMTSCVDDFKFYEEIGEGEALVTATVKFHPLISSEVKDQESRTPGNAITKIENFQIFIYNDKNELIANKVFKKGTFKIEKHSDMPTDLKDGDMAESEAECTTVSLGTMPYGRYKMYVVANYLKSGEFYVITDEEAETPLKLKNLKSDWNQTNISANAQMFGWFSPEDKSEGEDAPVLVIKDPQVSLNAWIKRLASKVTIVYDGHGLHQGINIYVRSVSIRDIPLTCVLGFDKEMLPENERETNPRKINGNSPDNKDQLIAEPDSGILYYKTIYQSGYSNEVDEVITSAIDPFNNNGNNFTIQDCKKLLTINKSVKAAGAVEVDGNHQLKLDSNGNPVAHQETMQALFFYENCQGDYADYPDKKLYNKDPYSDDVGKPQDYTGENYDELKENFKDEQGVYKDNVPYGTYIEVDAYYESTNPANQTNGPRPIKYRFMLGQDVTYNYNALRNRHYKLTLSFRGYANQPEWHIVYDEEDPGLYPRDEYYVSYLYNSRHDMPIRLTGKPYRVTLQIIENSWAPYDKDQDDEVALTYNGTTYGQTNNLASDGTYPPSTVNEFRWYRELYTQHKTTDYSFKPTGDFYYGLRTRSDMKSKDYITYSPPLPDDLMSKKVSPIWVGFLALQVPKAYETYSSILPTSIAHTEQYDQPITIQNMRDYYCGRGGIDSEHNNKNEDFKLYECSYEFDNDLPTEIDVPKQIVAHKGDLADGRNAATLVKNGDGSYTITPPLFTMPKDIGKISGFSGNNPYESFQRKAVVLVTAYYHLPDRDVKIVKQVPVFQVERLVNPKGVWRTGKNTKPFNVRLMYLDNYTDANYKQVKSDGEWSAWIATPKEEDSPRKDASIFLTGGDEKDEKGVIHGNDGSFVDFTINFHTGDDLSSHCEKVIVKYNSNSCEHAILVRRGYDEVVQLADAEHYDTNNNEDPNDNVKPALWSSFNVFAFEENVSGASLPNTDNPTTNLPGSNLDMRALLTINPLALGTLFKRGNYVQGIAISNNAANQYPVLVPVGNNNLTLIKMNKDGEADFSSSASWSNIKGIIANDNNARNWEWSTFTSTYNDQKRKYDLPTYADAEAILKLDIAAGVVYADGASETLSNVRQATGYFNTTNNLDESTDGMRGIIVYNSSNFNQIFFPIGYSGYGRRTVQFTNGNNGYLRYGAVYYCLRSTSTNQANQYRPISFNNPGAPGALYWLKKAFGTGGNPYAALDINYFDLNLSTYNAVLFADNGDAIPIKPVYIEDVND